MTTAYIVTFIGDDRPGLVEELSSVIDSNGGNWHESRLSQLGGKFAGLVSVSLPKDNGPALEEALRNGHRLSSAIFFSPFSNPSFLV